MRFPRRLFATLATGLLLLAGGVESGSLHGEELRSSVELPRGWKIQPAIEPEKMGVRETNPKGQAKVINDAVAIVHKWDPKTIIPT
ncbi:MAG: hypothetical protein WC661_21420 [Opitutaceae bacterium]